MKAEARGSRREDPRLAETIELVERAKSGDRLAANDLLERYYPCVRQVVALRMGRSAESFWDCEDVVQEAMMQIFLKLDRFEQRSAATFRNWVCRCVENYLTDYFRREGAQKRGKGRVRRHLGSSTGFLMSSVLADPKAVTPSQMAQAAELECRIEEALGRLPDHYREIFIMKRLLGMSHAEVATTLRISEVQARQICYLVRKRVRDELGL